MKALRFGSPAILPVLLAAVGLLAFRAGSSPIGPAVLGVRAFEETRVEGASFPKRLRDPAGAVQEIARPPQRVVSTILAADEILTALLPPDRLVGVTRLADDSEISNCADSTPPDAVRIHTADAEVVLALEPDVVFVAGYSRAEVVRLLVSSGVPVIRFGRYGSLDALQDNVRIAGAAVGAETRALEIVAEMDRRVAAVRRRVAGLPRPRVLYFTPSGFTSGPGTTIDEMIETAGGANVAAEAGLRGPVRISTEVALGLQPNVILLSGWRRDGNGVDPVRELLEDPLWRDVPAVQAGRVHALRGAWLTTVSQYAVRGVEEIARILHPEAFAQADPAGAAKGGS
ncbi:MAG: ABC transporter substrate-binding protein [Gammaproteobacteria bacterium]